jgi:hypothetical protein
LAEHPEGFVREGKSRSPEESRTLTLCAETCKWLCYHKVTSNAKDFLRQKDKPLEKLCYNVFGHDHGSEKGVFEVGDLPQWAPV